MVGPFHWSVPSRKACPHQLNWSIRGGAVPLVCSLEEGVSTPVKRGPFMVGPFHWSFPSRKACPHQLNWSIRGGAVPLVCSLEEGVSTPVKRGPFVVGPFHWSVPSRKACPHQLNAVHSWWGRSIGLFPRGRRVHTS